MLSKYYSYVEPDFKGEDALEASSLEMELGKKIQISDLKRICPGGTLGQFYVGMENGRKRFIKTHLPCDMAKENIEKEIYLMDFLYRDILHIDSCDIFCGGVSRKVLLMDFLEIHSLSPDITLIKKLLDEHRQNLKSLSWNQINYGESAFYDAVIHSYVNLIKVKQINEEITFYVEETLNNYNKYLTYEKAICHGDLSNINLAKTDETYLFLDWEDAMVGPPDYDLLYWLTFFSQRKYYSSLLFRDLGIDERYGKDIMVMILVVKSYLSYINGSYKNNTLSIQDRILEIIQM